MSRFLFLASCLIFSLLLWQCSDPADKVSEAIEAIPFELEVHRFEQAFDQMPPSGLPELKSQYPYLFPQGVPDSVWLAKQSDTLEIRLRQEVQKAFPDFDPYTRELESLFKHARYYFPEVALPEKLITLTTRVDMDNRVVLTDSLMLLGLDNFLGAEHEFYGSIDQYISRGMAPEFLVSDTGSALSIMFVPPPTQRSFVSQMVYHGKALYLKSQLMPQTSDSMLIGYTAKEWEWSRANEGQIWRYFVERELLYKTDRELGPRFLDPAPFSKFRLMLDNESPGRIGRYMGWRIVQAFMERGSHSLEDMLRMPGEALFQESRYKPPKE